MDALFPLPSMPAGPLRALVDARIAAAGADLPDDLALIVQSLADRIDYANRTNTYRGFVMLTAEYRSARDQLFGAATATADADPFAAALADSVRPRLATARTPSRHTDGAAGAFVAHCHGRPWVQWQRAAADLAGERADDGIGYAYSVVVIMVERQCGKTTFVFDLAMGRCLSETDYRAAYTAQTGHVTTERMSERMAEVRTTVLDSRIAQRRSQGTERFRFPHGSFLKAFPPKAGALRGSTLDLVIVDEAQEIDEALGVILDQEIVPTQQNRPRRQLILIGTAGTDKSKYLARHLAAARAGAPGYAVIEYGAGEGMDVTDSTLWVDVHPGLAAGLTTVGALRTALSVMGINSFSREYMNVWQTTSDRLVPAGDWLAGRHRDAVPAPAGVPVFGADVAEDRSAAVIVACWPATAGAVPVWEVVQYGRRTEWVAPRLRALHAAHGAPVYLDGGTGPAATVVDELAGAEWAHALSPREFATACAGAFDRITGHAVWHRGETALDAAVEGATRRPVSDGWVWARRSASTDVAPLVAATFALWGHEHRTPAPLRPVAAAG